MALDSVFDCRFILHDAEFSKHIVLAYELTAIGTSYTVRRMIMLMLISIPKAI